MVKRTVSLSDEHDDWYHSHLISLSKLVAEAIEEKIVAEKTFQAQLKVEFPPLVDQHDD